MEGSSSYSNHNNNHLDNHHGDGAELGVAEVKVAKLEDLILNGCKRTEV